MENTNDKKEAMFRLTIIVLLWAVSNYSTSCDVSASTIERQGEKGAEALVFIPGLASHGALWRPWAEKFSSSHNVYVVTASGFAGAPANLADQPFLETTVTEIAARLEKDGVSHATVVGHSIGGLMALMLAHDVPDLVDQLLIVDSLPYLAGMFMLVVTPDVAREQAKMIAGQLKNMPHGMFLAQQKQSLSRLSNTVEFLPTLIKWSEASDQATVAAAMGEALATDYRAALASIKSNITVLAAYSKMIQVPKAQFKALYAAQYAAAPNTKIQLVDDSYHFIMIDQSKVFSDALRQVVMGE